MKDGYYWYFPVEGDWVETFDPQIVEVFDDGKRVCLMGREMATDREFLGGEFVGPLEAPKRG